MFAQNQNPVREPGFDYSEKVITLEQALAMVKSGDNITVGMAGAEPVPPPLARCTPWRTARKT